MNTNPSNNSEPQSNLHAGNLHAGNLHAGNLQRKDLQWEIERYLLDDPAFDRDLFEQRMFNDTSLAEQVAASVAHLQRVAAAVDSTRIESLAMSSLRVTQEAPAQEAPANWMVRFVLLASAAVLLIAISAWQFRSAANDNQLARIADNWTAFENLTAEEVLELVSASESDSHSADSLRDANLRVDDPNDSTSNEQADWLVEAAQEFYLASNEGAAG